MAYIRVINHGSNPNLGIIPDGSDLANNWTKHVNHFAIHQASDRTQNKSNESVATKCNPKSMRTGSHQQSKQWRWLPNLWLPNRAGGDRTFCDLDCTRSFCDFAAPRSGESAAV